MTGFEIICEISPLRGGRDRFRQVVRDELTRIP